MDKNGCHHLLSVPVSNISVICGIYHNRDLNLIWMGWVTGWITQNVDLMDIEEPLLITAGTKPSTAGAMLEPMDAVEISEAVETAGPMEATGATGTGGGVRC